MQIIVSSSASSLKHNSNLKTLTSSKIKLFYKLNLKLFLKAYPKLYLYLT